MAKPRTLASTVSLGGPLETGVLTSTKIIAALGFTPYNSTNPSGFITSSGTVNNVGINFDNTTAASMGVWFSASGSGAPKYSAGMIYTPSTSSLTLGGTLTQNSDERLKTDWRDVPSDFVERLAAIKHGTYTRKDNGERQAGASAQAWQELIPEVVKADEKGKLSLAYGNAAVIAAIKLAQRVVDLERRLAALEA